ncbi:reverse transcriptase domain-containing protein [Tanacetum coccineum]
MAPKRTAATTTTSVIDAQLKALIARGVADALAERDTNRSRNGDDSHDSGTGVRRQAPVARECTYSDFLKCQPLNFKVACQIKFATCTLQGNALTWWNSYVKTVTHKVAYTVPWKTLKKMMIDKYCPRGEIKKLEIEMWNLKVKGTNVVSYNQHFQELALMCDRMFPEESDEIEKYVGGLPDMIHGKRQVENNRKLDNNNQAQQQPPKKQGVTITYIVGSSEWKEYAGTLPLCNKCKLYHNGKCTVKCANYKRVGHLTQDCRIPVATNNQRNLTCYECENQGHCRSDCPKLNNQNHRNQAGGTGARGMVHTLGGG